MKKHFLVWILCLISFGLHAQKSDQAKIILNKVEAVLKEAGGIRASFDGSSKGLLLMNEEKFYLNCNGIQTWYNGNTQWSYIADSEEVNISNPTLEELQSINPYILMQTYKKGYKYQYHGTKNINGRKGYEIELIPQEQSGFSSIILFISESYLPLNIKIISDSQEPFEFKITSYQQHQRLSDKTFEFDIKQYPQVEIIDLR